MNNDKKLTAADLAMYLGCECQIEAPGDEKFTAIMTGADVSSGRATVLVNGANYGPSTYIVANIKPILRRLSDMTEEEMREKHEAYLSACKSLGLLAHGTAADTRYLLSHHFDLFGWIDAGLAIDKTKLK